MARPTYPVEGGTPSPRDRYRSILAWELAGVVPIVLAGSALHFAFEWSGRWLPLAVIAAVNESVWEHMKLAFWPAVAWAMLTAWFRHRSYPNYWFAKAIGLLVVPVVISILYYGYKAVLRDNVLALDIGIFVIAILLGQLSTALILRHPIELRSTRTIGRILMALQLAAYGLFTYFPPPLPLFEETRSGLYGIPMAPKTLD